MKRKGKKIKLCVKKKKKPRCFIVNSRDLFDRKKNPNLSLSVRDIEKNKKIPKWYL